MKLNIIVPVVAALTVFGLTSCGTKTTNKAEEATDSPTPSSQLIALLGEAASQGKYLVGHHDDPAYGYEWQYEEGRSDVKETAGDYPGVMNWDLGLIELDSVAELDGVPFDFIRKEVAKQDARGGVNSFSWHLRHPGTGATSWDVEPAVVGEIVTDGSAMNDTMITWIGRAADFIGNLRDSEGNRIGVMFRPWHEHNGSWFWWGKNHSTPAEYKALWALTRRVFDEKGIDNVVWVYSPGQVEDEAEYLERYPGDEYVDILGCDIYHYGGEPATEDYRNNVNRTLGIVKKLADERGKLMALSETGIEALPMDNWFTEVLEPLAESYPITFVTLWRNAEKTTKHEHFYAPYKGHPAEQSFAEWTASPRALLAGDVANLRKAMADSTATK